MYTCIYWKRVGLSLWDFWDANIKAWTNMNCILMKACHVEMNIDSTGCSAHSWWSVICMNGWYNPQNKTEKNSNGFSRFLRSWERKVFSFANATCNIFRRWLSNHFGWTEPQTCAIFVGFVKSIFQQNGGCKLFFCFWRRFLEPFKDDLDFVGWWNIPQSLIQTDILRTSFFFLGWCLVVICIRWSWDTVGLLPLITCHSNLLSSKSSKQIQNLSVFHQNCNFSIKKQIQGFLVQNTNGLCPNTSPAIALWGERDLSASSSSAANCREEPPDEVAKYGSISGREGMMTWWWPSLY